MARTGGSSQQRKKVNKLPLLDLRGYHSFDNIGKYKIILDQIFDIIYIGLIFPGRVSLYRGVAVVSVLPAGSQATLCCRIEGQKCSQDGHHRIFRSLETK